MQSNGALIIGIDVVVLNIDESAGNGVKVFTHAGSNVTLLLLVHDSRILELLVLKISMGVCISPTSPLVNDAIFSGNSSRVTPEYAAPCPGSLDGL